MGTLRYPSTLDGTTDRITFNFYKYEPPLSQGASNRSNAYNFSSNASNLTSAGVDSISIAMPNDIQSSFSGDWGPKGMGGLPRAAIGAVGGAINAAMGKKDTTAPNFLSSIGGGLNSLVSGAAGGLVEDGIKGLVNTMNTTPGFSTSLGASDVVGLVSGFIINPNTELLYGGTSLRQHGYNFKMMALDENDSIQMLAIAEVFKKCSAPKGGDQSIAGLTNRNFLGIPDVCQVSFHLGNSTSEHPYLPRFKVSAITKVNVDYVTEGQYMTYSDGRPIGINLSVSFTELKMVFSEEIGSGTDKYR